MASYGLATLAEPYYLDDGTLTFVAPAGAYAPVPAWHSGPAWLGAVKLHPRLGVACRARRVAESTFLDVLGRLAAHADVETGRDIAVAHATIGEQLGRCEKTIQRACRVAEDLGLLVRVLAGADMSLAQRITVLRHFTRGTRGAKWRSLPNFYAATMPRRVVDLVEPKRSPKRVRRSDQAWSVDNSGVSPVHGPGRVLGDVHLPVGSTGLLKPAVSLLSKRTTFEPDCGQPAQPARPTASSTPAARPTTAHRQTASDRAPGRLDPAVQEFARALRASLLGYRSVSLRRICPAVSLYVRAGLRPADIKNGLDGYMAATGRTWLTRWGADQQAEQARYLVGMITAARRAGWISLPP